MSMCIARMNLCSYLYIHTPVGAPGTRRRVGIQIHVHYLLMIKSYTALWYIKYICGITKNIYN